MGEREAPLRSALSCRSDAATASSSRSSSRASESSSTASSRSRSNSRPMTAAALSAVRASEPRRSTRRPITSRTLWGRPSSARSPTRRQRPPSCLHDRAGLRQVAQHLTGKERVARRLTRDLRGERTPVLVELMPSRRFHQREHVLRVKAGELDSLDALLAVQIGKQRRQRMLAREIRVTVGPHHHHRNRGARRHDVAKQRQRR